MRELGTTAGEVHTDLGANHHMWTYASVWENDWVTARTRTASFTWFGGYVGTVATVIVDSNNQLVGVTDQLSYGVNGTLFGGSDRTETWNQLMRRTGPGTVPARILVAHGWRFEARSVVKMVEAFKTVAPFIPLLV